MDTLVIAAATLGFLLLFLGLGIWVFISLALVATASLFFLDGMGFPRIGSIAASIIYRYSTSWELSAIPMFIWMGEIIFRTDISTRLFRGLSPFVDYIPGRLFHTNVLGCTLFAAVSGSSPATTATVGRITTRELAKRGYDDRLSLGSLAGAGSLGLMIPPSIVMIVYGILAEQSISRLFAAGVLPGLMICALFSGYIMIRATLNPALVPAKRESRSVVDFLRALLDLAPLAVLMTIVLGSIYSGIATPSEAAAIGVIAAIFISIVTRQLSLTLLRDTLMGALRTSTMVCSILIAAAFMSTAIGYLHIPADVADGIASLDLPPWGLLLVLSLFYLGLGFFLDGTSIVVMSLPISLPLALQAGFDPIWFGIYLVLMIEMAQVTPPVGFNLFVLQGISGRPLSYVSRAALPFFVLMLVGVALLAVFPGIALWLPNSLYG
ncbi:C4-dicarboxylate TRAP transporter large permease protein DctM (plasmid) [Pseudosulfitobacter pseudonitzschiae]|uniref:TRAP transporter large permease protein n=1 Tax=Pseudosulfitobacter pseudonitzschiae TaxID=1402135 RepID=A0A221K9H4_9RHOB|nr:MULTISPECIES: TRAP transporter large permease subunit [Roseobacteraceae]ASM75507.1 C4-dicarboxylate TRAP transporter large permease protein DctM [Pseudosulfitobacter pseudonitzschiae]